VKQELKAYLIPYSNMLSIQDIIKQKIESLGKKEKSLNERQSLLKELYEVYELENKIENYCRYLHWLKKNKKPRNNETASEFKKVKLEIDKKYIKPNTKSYFAIRLSHIPTKDLYYLTSMSRDYCNRNHYKRSAFTKYLFGSIKAK